MTPTPRSDEADAAAEAVRRLIAAQRTIAVAESLTGGRVVAALVDTPGASAVVRGGVVAYATPLKSSLLGVDARLLDSRGPVDPAVAAAMAEGARRAAAIDGVSADFGIATTGVAGPDAQGDAPVGLVFVAVADAAGTEVRELRLEGGRQAIRDAATREVLTLLLTRLDAHREG
ncbi:CinA family protein [Microcella alkalica]|uniref:Nicotinamide-nucleotide amidase n=1 Tax=Microcella alkalica TaxID=355930 RepID=A0A839EBL6_9MICO|nr:nicotinamide-nucleotide amidase [Microcella alkalica]